MFSFIPTSVSVKAIYDDIRKIKASNTGEILDEPTAAKIDFYRDIGNDVFRQAPPVIKTYLDSDILLGVLAEFYKCGDCTEQVALAVMKLLESRFDGVLEHMYAVGSGTEVYNEKDSGNHHFIMLNRDQKSDLQKPLLWRGVLFDPWDQGNLKDLSADVPLVMQDVTHGDFVFHKMTSYLGAVKKLSADDWRSAAKMLEASLVVIKENEANYFKYAAKYKIKLTEAELKQEHANLLKFFEAKIAKYNGLAAGMEVKVGHSLAKSYAVAAPNPAPQPQSAAAAAPALKK